MSVLGKVEIVVCGVLGDVEAWELAGGPSSTRPGR
jgi:hypothetical protein